MKNGQRNDVRGPLFLRKFPRLVIWSVDHYVVANATNCEVVAAAHVGERNFLFRVDNVSAYLYFEVGLDDGRIIRKPHRNLATFRKVLFEFAQPGIGIAGADGNFLPLPFGTVLALEVERAYWRSSFYWSHCLFLFLVVLGLGTL